MALGIIILAAGESKRMGTCKALLPWKSKTILDHICTTLSGDGDYDVVRLAVVNGREKKLTSIVENYGFSTVINNQPEWGQGYSIQLAMRAVDEIETQENKRIDGVLFSVCDQPLLSTMVVERIVGTFYDVYSKNPRAIVIPQYRNVLAAANPVVFSAYWFSRLRQLSSDVGGRSIIYGEGKTSCVYVPIYSDVGIDVDTMEEYQLLYDKYHR